MVTKYKMMENFKETKLDHFNGHEVLFEFHVHHLVGKVLWHVVKDYDTNCQILPTSWLLEMKIKQVQSTGDISIPVTLKRNDTINRPVKANMILKFTDANNRFFFDGMKSFGERVMMPGEGIRSNIQGCILLPEERKLFNEELHVTVSIKIRSCHLDGISNPLTYESIDREKKLCSMM